MRRRRHNGQRARFLSEQAGFEPRMIQMFFVFPLRFEEVGWKDLLDDNLFRDTDDNIHVKLDVDKHTSLLRDDVSYLQYNRSTNVC